MKDIFDYSKYKCPYEHLEKECGHELKGPEGYQGTYGVWCECGYRGPLFYLDPKDLKLELKDTHQPKQETCNHKRVTKRINTNCFPYGDDIEVKMCQDCGLTL